MNAKNINNELLSFLRNLNNKRGVSGVVTAVLLTLLVIAAVGIFWVVVQNFVSQQTGGLRSSTGCLDTRVEVILVDESTGLVKVRRNSGSEELTKVNVYVDNGVSKKVTEFDYSISGTPISVGEIQDVTLSTFPSIGDKVSATGVIGSQVCGESSVVTAPFP